MPNATPTLQTPSSSTSVFHHHQLHTMFLYLSSILLPLLLIFFSFFFYTTTLNHKQIKKVPPGSLGWLPFLGQTLSFIVPHPVLSTGKFIDYSTKRYGKIFRSHLFGDPTIVSCDGDFNLFVLQNEDRLIESGYPEQFRRISGPASILTTVGEQHRRLRTVAVDFLTSIKNPDSTILPDIEDNALFVMGSWRNKKTINFCEEAQKFTFYVIAKQALSLGPEDPRTTQFFTGFQTFMKGLVTLPINFPGTPYARAIQARQKIFANVKEIMHETEKKKGEDRKVDFLDAIMMHELSEEETVSSALALLVGGHETTTMLIAAIVRFLADNPKALQQLKEEHELVRRKKGSNKRLGWDDFADMTFTHDVIKESLRCTSIATFVFRKTIKPIHYNGFEIPMGWKVMPMFNAVHLDPTIYPDPQKFNPWRWQSKEMKGMGGSKYFFPFCGGKRLCPGAELTKLETAFFLHHLVLNFEWTPLIAKEQPMALPYVDFKHGLQLSINPLPNSMFATT